jgi:TPR repeat protein
VEKNLVEAARLIKNAAERGDRDAQYQLALLYGNGLGVAKNDQQALDWLRKAAEKRHEVAQYLLAVIYARGLYSVARDDKLAVEWMRRSARQGYAEAQYGLGIMYGEGRGVPKDASESYGWLLEASKNGNVAAKSYVDAIRAGTSKPEFTLPPLPSPETAPK